MSLNNRTNEQLFSSLLNNKTKRGYWDNVSALRSRHTKEIFDRCVLLTRSSVPKVRATGIDVLAQFGYPRAFKAETNKLFFRLLKKEKDPKPLSSLLSAIGHNNNKLNKEQIGQLCKLRNATGEGVKESLVFALLTINDNQAVDVLIKLSADKINHIRDWATFGLGTQTNRNNKKIREALWARVNDKHTDTQYEAIVGLARRKDPRVKAIIERELLRDDYGSLLFEAITELGDISFLATLRKQYRIAKNDNTIDSGWLADMKDCIAALGKKQESITTAGLYLRADTKRR